MLPALAARLGERVARLVFVAGLSARHGETVMRTVRPDAEAELATRLTAMRDEYRRLHARARPVDRRRARRSTPRPRRRSTRSTTWNRRCRGTASPCRSRGRSCAACGTGIQSRVLQDALIENCGAADVIDLESGHTPAVAVPDELAAALLDRIAASSPAPA